MTDRDIGVILRRLDKQDGDLGHLRQETAVIKKLAQGTNGRVDRLETDKAVAEALAQHEHIEREIERRQRNSRWTAWSGAGVASVGLLIVYLILEVIAGRL